MKLKTTLVLAAAVLGFASVTHAAGIVGQQVLGATYDYTDIEDLNDSTDGVSIFYNHPLAPSWDINLRYGHDRGNLLGWDVKDNEYEFGLTYYRGADYGKAFITPFIGYADMEFGPTGDDTFYYGGKAGYEFPLGTKWSVTPFVAYTDANDYEGVFSFGVRGDVDVSEKFGVFGAIERTENEDTTFSLGGLFRF